MKRIAIIGAGGQAREIAWLIRDVNRVHPVYELTAYVVEDLSKLTGEYDHSLVRDEAWLQGNREDIDCLTIGIGSPAIRCRLAAELSERFPELEWPALVHPRSIVDNETSIIGRGVQICAGAICTTHVGVGPFTLMNFGCTVGHDVQIGTGCVINPGANISGGVIIEDGVLVGTGAQVLQYRRVGRGATVGAGCVVVKDVPDGVTVAGIPASPLQR